MTETLKLALAQFNATVGNIAGNAEGISCMYREAVAKGAQLVVFPELSLIGYPPEDLVLMPSFRQQAMREAEKLAAQTKGSAAMVIGSVWELNGKVHNAALLLSDGKVVHVEAKTSLPNYGVFDEKRIFSPSAQASVAQWNGVKLGLLVCEDVWTTDAGAKLKSLGAELLIVINASPYEPGKMARRREVAARTAKATSLPLAYVNVVGGQDDIVFDGGSFALSSDGSIAAQLCEFSESVSLVTLKKESSGWRIDPADCPLMSKEESLWQAMMLGLSDYVNKNKFPGVFIGLSGGIDSALTAVAAVDALGADRVQGVLLPSPYTSKDSVEDATTLAKSLGIKTVTVPITPGMQTFEEILSPIFRDAQWMEDVSVGGNLQARLRGLTLMSLSNKTGFMLMATGNKSEIAVGYTTLYGDSCGGYNVLKDLYKMQIYALADWRNKEHPQNGKGPKGAVIPVRSITRPPSAELAPGQKDEDQLPPYTLLDRILYHHIEERRGAEEIIALGFDKAIVEKVVKLVRNSEYKRRQSCPGVKLSPMLFGRDRRYPLTNKF